MKVHQPSYVLFLVGILAASALGCSKVSFKSGGSSSLEQSSQSGDGTGIGTNEVIGPTGPQVCDPFGGSTAVDGKGLIGEIHYIPSGVAQPNNLAEFFQRSVKLPLSLLLSQVNVPTRDFTQGFNIGSTYVRDASGNILNEWFAIRMLSVLSLRSGQGAGYYQFRVDSDDGMILYQGNAASTVLINNDGVHSPATKCSSSALYMDGNSRMPIKFDYFQGPRTQIELVLSWRQVANASGNSCDDSGWEVIPAQNFNLPANTVRNCQ